MSNQKPVASLADVKRRVLTDPASGTTREYYVGSIRSDIVRALTFVPVKESSSKTYLAERLDHGYQRPGSGARMRAFGNYVDDNPLSVVPPVILSGRDAWKYNPKTGSIDIFDAAAVVDGQHRLGGYVYLYEKDGVPRELDFFVLADLTLEEETAEFLAINDTQKGVPKSLNIILGGSDDSIVAVALDEQEDSPFKNRITQVKKQRGDLFSAAAVTKNIGRTFQHGAFEGMTIDEKLDVMIRYWDMIADFFPEEWQDMERDSAEYKLLETTGLIAWSLAGEDILGPAFDPETRTMNWDQVEVRIKRLAVDGALDWRKTGEFQGLTGEVGGAKIHKKIQLLLSAQQSS